MHSLLDKHFVGTCWNLMALQQYGKAFSRSFYPTITSLFMVIMILIFLTSVAFLLGLAEVFTSLLAIWAISIVIFTALWFSYIRNDKGNYLLRKYDSKRTAYMWTSAAINVANFGLFTLIALSFTGDLL